MLKRLFMDEHKDTEVKWVLLFIHLKETTPHPHTRHPYKTGTQKYIYLAPDSCACSFYSAI